MKRRIYKRFRFLRAVLRGMGAPAFMFESEHRGRRVTGYPHANEMEAMRSDWLRIGGDFQTAVKREETFRATTQS
ncbi:hypothetical protein [Pseudazoarcus pumilus]|uniref:hypothetical protein n=1 Tax=Pseudazoarcus pumilus TaxID=2067960 RepID=UPI000F4FB765|nr:hypothetical protein [Pseudazoarcus pumilus]